MQFLEAVDMPTPRAVLVLYSSCHIRQFYFIYFSYIDITVNFIAKVAIEISVILNTIWTSGCHGMAKSVIIASLQTNVCISPSKA
jgi:hypothetical protein